MLLFLQYLFMDHGYEEADGSEYVRVLEFTRGIGCMANDTLRQGPRMPLESDKF